jgi:hypothetical protein
MPANLKELESDRPSALAFRIIHDILHKTGSQFEPKMFASHRAPALLSPQLQGDAYAPDP